MHLHGPDKNMASLRTKQVFSSTVNPPFKKQKTLELFSYEKIAGIIQNCTYNQFFSISRLRLVIQQEAVFQAHLHHFY